MLIEQITKRFKKKIINYDIESIKFKWEFEDLFDVLNINNFFTMMQYQLRVEYNFNQEQDIREKINIIRRSIEDAVQVAKNIEINSNKLGVLDNLIHMIYMEIKDIINDGLIMYLFYEKIHCSIEFEGQLLDTDDFFKLKLMIFNKNLDKHLDQFLKSNDINNENDYSF
ncbi:hypothetical protein [Spiroplasma monobiae]|uniref:Uncharacterized protein n=1 Tax=Spiroplasma monobiae MQ-1 TaxID=1336748 RepID=A0A2K9LUY6_SPISQ|nr:hypothetical protein [Spiroplasma monobiae]AUM62859.1 hypothetical protein SMONO_v1c06100 [Spiroplasma monobiae MQ-1]